MPARRHDLDVEWRVLKRGGRLAIGYLAIGLAFGGQENLKLAQVIQFSRQSVQGLELMFLRDGLAAALGV